MSYEERISRLEKVLATINADRRFKDDTGDSLVIRGNAKESTVPTISTGSIVLDHILGGGFGKGRIVEVYGAESSGKCLPETARVLTEYGYVTLKDVFEHLGYETDVKEAVTDVSDSGFCLINENGVPEPVKLITHNGLRRVRTITLCDGRRLTATLNHPVRVIDEDGFILWRRFEDLSTGDKVVSLLGGCSLQSDPLTSFVVGETFSFNRHGDVFIFSSDNENIVREIQLILRGVGVVSSVSEGKDGSYLLSLNTVNAVRLRDRTGFNVGVDDDEVAEESASCLLPIARSTYSVAERLIKDVGSREDVEKLLPRKTEDLVLSEEQISNVVSWAEGFDNISDNAKDLVGLLKKFSSGMYTFDLIVDVLDEEAPVPTFDVTLEETHSFVAEGIVNHNTSIALTAVGNVQKSGGTAVYIDAENALDPRYAAKLGVNMDDLFLAQPDTAERALDLIRALTESGTVDIIVLDSVASIVPKAELEGDAGDQTVGALARLMSKELRKLVGPAQRNGTTIIFINQTRDKIGGWAPAGMIPQTTPGGKALKFYASQRVRITKGKSIDGNSSTKASIGNIIKFKIEKNKIAPPFGTGETVLTFAKGINLPAEIMETGPSIGILERPNPRKWVETETGEIIGNSKAEALDRISSDKDLFDRLIKAMRKKMEEYDGTDMHDAPETDDPVESDDE